MVNSGKGTQITKKMTSQVICFAEDLKWTGVSNGCCCLHDTEPFEGVVYSYPVRRELGIWYVRGIFCSLECTKRYLLDHFPLGSNLINLFSLMCHLVYHRKFQIPPAPSQGVLQKFSLSGGLTITDFRKSFIETVQPPVYPFLVDLVEYVTEKVVVPSVKAVLPLPVSKTQPKNTLDDFLKLDSDSLISDDEIPEELDQEDFASGAGYSEEDDL